MRVFIYSAEPYDREYLNRANAQAGAGHELVFHQARLDRQTADMAQGCSAACLFVNDIADAAALQRLAKAGVEYLALRSAGHNHVDLEEANRLGISVGHVPAYSPSAVAEHAIALILALNRKIHRAYARVREGNFSLDGLMGFDLNRRTIGLVGTGEIGMAAARIAHGFGCRLMASDPVEKAEFAAMGGRYVPIAELLADADIISLHCPLTPQTRHLIGREAISTMKHGVMLINTCRGAVIDTQAAISGLKSGKIGALGIDVYEEESELFFRDRSSEIIQDDVFARLLTFPNVIVTSHQGFFTHEAVTAIAETTIGNLSEFERTGQALHQIDI